MLFTGMPTMPDEIDRAQAREEEIRADAIRAQLRRTLPAGDSASECAMCGEPIPEARRAALPGVQTCIDCQREVERLGLCVKPMESEG
jgi:phage/conjugal plasmid C-4 type zinc finger TraR family protein